MLNRAITKAADAVRRLCHCHACGGELLRTPRGSVCGDWQCSASPIASPLPPPEAVRDAQLRAAGYRPASAIRPAMPTLQRHRPTAPEPSEPDPESAEQRARQRAEARERAETRVLLVRGEILRLEDEIERRRAT